MCAHHHKAGTFIIYKSDLCSENASLRNFSPDRHGEFFAVLVSNMPDEYFLFSFLLRLNPLVNNMKKAYLIPYHTAYFSSMCKCMFSNRSKIPGYNYKLLTLFHNWCLLSNYTQSYSDFTNFQTVSKDQIPDLLLKLPEPGNISISVKNYEKKASFEKKWCNYID